MRAQLALIAILFGPLVAMGYFIGGSLTSSAIDAAKADYRAETLEITP